MYMHTYTNANETGQWETRVLYRSAGIDNYYMMNLPKDLTKEISASEGLDTFLVAATKDDVYE